MNYCETLRLQFPFFTYHPRLAYLDNAATTQKLAAVIDATATFYCQENAPVHRALYQPAARTSERYEQVRQQAARYLGAKSPDEIVFTSGTTAGLNLVAQAFLAPRLRAGDEVVVTALEHHSNYLPWQQVCRTAGAKFLVALLTLAGELDLSAFRQMLTERTRLVAVSHVSNVLGTVLPVAELAWICQQKNIPLLVDGAQGAAHHPLDVAGWGVDFYACSGHKLYGPTGTGLLYAKAEHLAAMHPWQFGGGMVRDATSEPPEFAPPPRRFEAGTPNVAGVIGLGAALEFLQNLDQAALRSHLQTLTEAVTDQLLATSGLEIIGSAPAKSAVVSFALQGVHPHDLATFLAHEDVAVRAGHHCAQPLMAYLGLPGTVRASFACYNSLAEVERLAKVVGEARRFFAGQT